MRADRADFGRPPMNEPSTRKPDPTPKRGKWLLVAVLAAVAAFLYVSIIVKVAKYGF
jgi:hypothetical protein